MNDILVKERFQKTFDGGHDGAGLKKAAMVVGDVSGIAMEVFTEEPAVQFYRANFMQPENTVRGGTKDDFRTAFCLETQHFPDSPNHPLFPGTIFLFQL